MDSIIVKTHIDWIHILATITWIGGMFTNLFIIRPTIYQFLSPADAGKFLGAMMKRFRIMVYGSIVVLGITGIPLKIINENYISIINFENNWEIISFIKHICYGVLVLIAIYSFEFLSPRVVRVAETGPSAELQSLRKRQMALGGFAFLTALVILILSSLMRYI